MNMRTNIDVTMASDEKVSSVIRPKVNIERAAKMWAEGAKQIEMSARLGISMNAVKNLVQYHRDQFPVRERAAVDRTRLWSDEELAAAAKLWAEGRSAPEIGEVFGVSRLAVLGLAYRHRDKFPLRNKAGHKATRPKKPSPSTRAVKPLQFKCSTPPEAAILPTDYDEGRLGHSKTLLELGSCECKWPLNEGGPFLFCAETTIDSGSYCFNHAQRALPVDRRVVLEDAA